MVVIMAVTDASALSAHSLTHPEVVTAAYLM